MSNDIIVSWIRLSVSQRGKNTPIEEATKLYLKRERPWHRYSL
ncbi:hypothetical protein [Sporisorium scitamineum]|uniref:Uncharacterized protein n=1 Tax=Sporisorium scitamineum TaxID=49012 RepID=A0A0F7S8E3_9BASI|nr:hypothetical protein [Sporisorium scitamineum]